LKKKDITKELHLPDIELNLNTAWRSHSVVVGELRSIKKKKFKEKQRECINLPLQRKYAET
jgi:hypothetical protein